MSRSAISFVPRSGRSGWRVSAADMRPRDGARGRSRLILIGDSDRSASSLSVVFPDPRDGTTLVILSSNLDHAAFPESAGRSASGRASALLAPACLFGQGPDLLAERSDEAGAVHLVRCRDLAGQLVDPPAHPPGVGHAAPKQPGREPLGGPGGVGRVDPEDDPADEPVASSRAKPAAAGWFPRPETAPRGPTTAPGGRAVLGQRLEAPPAVRARARQPGGLLDRARPSGSARPGWPPSGSPLRASARPRRACRSAPVRAGSSGRKHRGGPRSRRGGRPLAHHRSGPSDWRSLARAATIAPSRGGSAALSIKLPEPGRAASPAPT